MSDIRLDNIKIGKRQPLVFILGPCVIESYDHTLFMAEQLRQLAERLKFPLIFKASFDKANRSSVDSYRGPGLEKGLKILQAVKEKCQLPVLTDVHETGQVAPVAEVADVIQIPAFLCRQTDLLLAAGQTGKAINVKKGQFVAPQDMQHAVRKIESTGNRRILLTERGASFGYGALIADIRAVPIMQKTGYPVIFDATHSAQAPGGGTTGGSREFIPCTARAMVAAGCNGIFMEVHDEPERALSDRSTQYPLAQLSELIGQLITIRMQVKDFYD